MPGIRIPGLSDTLKEKVISFLKEIKGVSDIKSTKGVEFVYNESKFIVGKFYDSEFIVFRKAKNGSMLTNNMRSKSFKDFKERLPKFISLNFRKRTLPYVFYKNDKIEASVERPFSYNGKIITASSKEEAIHKIVAVDSIDDLKNVKSEIENGLKKVKNLALIDKISSGADIYCESTGLGHHINFAIGVWGVRDIDVHVTVSCNIGDYLLDRHKSFKSVNKVVEYCDKMTKAFLKYKKGIKDVESNFWKEVKSA